MLLRYLYLKRGYHLTLLNTIIHEMSPQLRTSRFQGACYSVIELELHPILVMIYYTDLIFTWFESLQLDDNMQPG